MGLRKCLMEERCRFGRWLGIILIMYERQAECKKVVLLCCCMGSS